MSQLKKELYNLCLAYVHNRIETSGQALEASKQSANEETKSSAGDKYETSREMMQQETDRNQAQLNEGNKLMLALSRISTDVDFNAAEPGSVVITDNGNFYLAISAGVLMVDGKSYFAVSPASPIGSLLKAQKTGYQFSLNGKNYKILDII